MTSTSANQSTFEAIAAFLIADRHEIPGLTTEDRRLAEIGCLLAVDPSSPEMGAALREALDGGMPARLLEAVLVHSLGYLGVVTVRRTFETLEIALAERGLRVDRGALVESDRRARESTGARLYDRFDPGRQLEQARKFEPLSSDYYPRAMELSGLVLGSAELALRERQIVTVALLSSLGGQAEQLKFHMGVALRNGVERSTVAAILIMIQAYAGMPRANSAAALALDALEQFR